MLGATEQAGIKRAERADEKSPRKVWTVRTRGVRNARGGSMMREHMRTEERTAVITVTQTA